MEVFDDFRGFSAELGGIRDLSRHLSLNLRDWLKGGAEVALILHAKSGKSTVTKFTKPEARL